MVNKPIVDYENPGRTAAKRELRRYTTTVLLVSLAVGALLVWGGRQLLIAGSAYHIGWITHLGPSARQLIGFGFLCLPLGLGILLRNRAERRLIGPELDAEKAEEKCRLNEEQTGVGWKVPKSAEAADWPKVVLFTVLMYAVTFLAILALGIVVIVVDWLVPSRRFLDNNDSVPHAAFLCANGVGVGIPAMFLFMLLAFPRVKITLLSEGVFERFGTVKKLIPYASIHDVRIAPSRRRRSLKCIAILANDERFGERWHRYDLGDDAHVGEIVKAFESKGLSVTTVDSDEALDSLPTLAKSAAVLTCGEASAGVPTVSQPSCTTQDTGRVDEP